MTHALKYKTTSEIIQNPVQLFWNGVDTFAERLNRQKALYAEICAYAAKPHTKERIVQIKDLILCEAVLQTFNPALPEAVPQAKKLYDVAFDRLLGALIIANRGATLWCLSPRTETPYLTRHIGMAIYLPGLGLETVNVGLVGDVYNGRIALRSESACTPSFLFGSQRCNCCHQWDSFRELAAALNPCEEPPLCKEHFEKWVQEQAERKEGKHTFKNSGPGLVFIHLDSQNGMGSGVTAGEFSMDLFNRASMRHRGEYSAEQILGTSMAGGFKAIGLRPDPRSEEGNLGYCVTPLVLDYLKVSRDLIFLSNNRSKMRELRACGYRLHRVKSLGKINQAGALEAEQRGTEFGHIDIDGCCVEFGDEMERLKTEVTALLKQKNQRC